jgi:hypothetical protein
MIKSAGWVMAVGLLAAVQATAGVVYVDLGSLNPIPPYGSWSTAATNLQQAIDAASSGDQILVSNGVYQAGGRVVRGTLTNRVVIDKPVRVQSVNGPAVTVIRGYQMPGQVMGPSAIRCAYLTNGGALVGFTVTNGATRSVGEEPPPEDNVGAGVWCESLSEIVSNCIVSGNTAGYYGGGIYGGTVFDCAIRGNSAYVGGGTHLSTLQNCVLSDNSAHQYGFGRGGGASSGLLDGCTLSGNSADAGGGADSSTLNHCLLTGNSAQDGGGASSSVLNNCTVTLNTAAGTGGGSQLCTNQNCLLFYNNATSGTNYSDGTLDYCCTTPLPATGSGNIAADPELASNLHLSAGSPCRGAGSAAFTVGVDIDGEIWLNPPSIGADEFHAGSITGPLTVAFDTTFTNVAAGFDVYVLSRITGHAAASRWEFGDGTIVSNRPAASHHWNSAGTFALVLRAYNETYPGGISATTTVQVLAAPVYYVALDGTNPVPPYTSWDMAATNIQTAVDGAFVGGTVLVSNGVYATGQRSAGLLTNRLAVTKPLALRSLNGPGVTSIVGYQVPTNLLGNEAIRCVYLTNGALLAGFTLTQGATHESGDPSEGSGGAVFCPSTGAIISNCIVTGNASYWSGGGIEGGTVFDSLLQSNSTALYGGGANGSTLTRCVLVGNGAGFYGGGANSATLNWCVVTNNSCGDFGGGASGGNLNNCLLAFNNASFGGGGASFSGLSNCTLVANSAYRGGGVDYCGAFNSILYYNSASLGANYYDQDLNYCCTVPAYGTSFDSPPLFVNQGGGDFRLQPTSPCINSGRNLYTPVGGDLAGNSRTAGGTVDVGAYEFQSPTSLISYAWLQRFGLPLNGSADFSDPDGDHMNNWQEWQCDSNPGDGLSFLHLLTPVVTASNLLVRWQSVPTRSYILEKCTNLAAQPLFLPVAPEVPGQPDETVFAETNALGASYYRVRVQ